MNDVTAPEGGENSAPSSAAAGSGGLPCWLGAREGALSRNQARSSSQRPALGSKPGSSSRRSSWRNSSLAAAGHQLQPFRLTGPRAYPAGDAQRNSRPARPSTGEDHHGPRPAPLAAAHADPGRLAWAAGFTAGHAPASLAGPRRTRDIGHDCRGHGAGRRSALSGPDVAGDGNPASLLAAGPSAA